MVTFLSGGTGTPKLLAGAESVFPPAETTVVGNTGDDVELAGHLVCPDLDTVLFLDGEVLDTETWWGIADDTATTHDELLRLADGGNLDDGPRYLSDEAQTSGRPLSRWRRFSGVAEFMHIGDRDRAVHLTRTGLLDEGRSLTEATRTLADAFGLERALLPMSDDPVATLIHTPGGAPSSDASTASPARSAAGVQHFQEWWVAHRGEPTVERVEFRGADEATPTDAVLTALDDPVVIGPSNPVTSIGPMLAMEEFEDRLRRTPVVAVSPFVEDEVFSGPAADLMAATGYEPSTAGVAEAYPFADAFVLDDEDGTELERPVVRTDTAMDDAADAERVARSVEEALAVVA